MQTTQQNTNNHQPRATSYEPSATNYQLLICFLLLASGVLTAQPQLNTHFMRNTAQAGLTNPALIPQQDLHIMLPNIFNGTQITGPAFGDIFTENADGEVALNVNDIIDNLEDENTLRENLDLETAGVVFSIGKLRFNVHHAVRFGAFAKYPKTLPQLIWEGNAQFIGQTIDLSNDLQILGYNEFGVGASFKFWKLALGGRLKWLNGIGDVSTDRNEASLYTDDDAYQLTLAADYRANTSSFLRYNGFGDVSADPDFGNFEFKRWFTKNQGVAFDVGAALDLGKVKIAVSMVDIGSINWKENVRNYSSNATFTYDGLDISNAIGGDTFTVGNVLDTLESIFKVVETNNEYSTDLPSKMYLSATWQLNDLIQLGGLYYRETYRGQDFSGIAVNANFNLVKWAQFGATYAIFEDSYANIGLNGTVKLGPVQLLAATDNIVAVINPDKANFSNVRFGMNLVF